jgi:hypothetical protein
LHVSVPLLPLLTDTDNFDSTPWLVTRRRTCPICKGDVVRSLSHSYQSPSSRPSQDDPDSVQIEASETRNDSSSASRPIPTSTRDLYDDVEANWSEHEEDEHNDPRGLDIPRSAPADLSSSFRELSSTVQTTIWRGMDAIRGATGFQRRSSPEDVDRDR